MADVRSLRIEMVPGPTRRRAGPRGVRADVPGWGGLSVTLAGLPSPCSSCIVAWPRAFWNLPVPPVTASRNGPEVLDRHFRGIRTVRGAEPATGTGVRLRQQREDRWLPR
jgi:hypothetical protein